MLALVHMKINGKSNNVSLWTKDFMLISAATVLTYMGYMVLMPTLPLFFSSLGMTEADIGLLIGVSSITAMLVRPFTGKYLDTMGRKIVFIIGLAILLFSSLIYDYLHLFAFLIGVRLLHGTGYGIATTVSATIAADVMPSNKIEKGMIYFSYAATIAFAIAPALGLHIINRFNFNILFMAAAAFAFIAVMIALKINYHQDDHQSSSEKNPLYDKKALPSVLILFLILFSFSSVVVLLPLYAVQLGISNIGSFFVIYAVTICLIRPFAAYLVERKGYDYVVIPSLLSYCLASYYLAAAEDMFLLNLSAILFGIAVGNIAATMKAHVMKDVPYNRRGVVSGMYYNAMDLGHGIGPFFWGLILPFSGYQVMYRISIIPGIIAIIVYLTVAEFLHKQNIED